MAMEDFEALCTNAGKRYAETAGKNLQDLPMPRTTEELIQNVEGGNKRYEHFREKQVGKRPGSAFVAILSTDTVC